MPAPWADIYSLRHASSARMRPDAEVRLRDIDPDDIGKFDEEEVAKERLERDPERSVLGLELEVVDRLHVAHRPGL